MVKDPVAQLYLEAIDGRWAEMVVTEFSFLEDHDGEIISVLFHQTGDSIVYGGRDWSLELWFAPDNYPRGIWLSAGLTLGTKVSRIGSNRDPGSAEQRRNADRPDEGVIGGLLKSWASAVATLIEDGRS
jgi:hypothetical protein